MAKLTGTKFRTAMSAADQRARLAKMGKLRAEIAVLKRRRRWALARVRVACALSRKRASDRARAAARSIRSEARHKCAGRRDSVRERVAGAIGLRARTLAEIRRNVEDARSDRRKAPSRRRATEIRRESDDEVRANLEPDLIPIFDRVRKSIVGNPKMSRTEAFLHWLGENEAESHVLRSEAADRKTAELVAELKKQEAAHHFAERVKAGRGDMRRRGEPRRAMRQGLLPDAPF